MAPEKYTEMVEGDLWNDSLSEPPVLLRQKYYTDFLYGWCDNLHGRDLSESRFKAVEFEETDLSKTTWDDCHFDKVIFRRCNLTSASFARVTADRVTFVECTLDEVDFGHSQLHIVSFVNCIGRVFFDDAITTATEFDQCVFEDSQFTATDLLLAKFKNCDLTGSIFYEASLKHTIFEDCDLSECDMEGAKFIHDALSGPDFTNCYISPVGIKENTRLTESLESRAKKVDHGPAFTPVRDAVLFCSNYKELEAEF